ncbi:MAG: sigma-70 family RNA polymerase sigma factor [Enhygromyxa sp.]
MVSTDAEDLALVTAAKAGDKRAFKVLMQRYQRKVYAVAFGFLRNQEDALDVVQESFIKVHRYIAKFEGNSSFYTWLYRIVANLCIDHLRKAKRHRDVEFDDGLRHDSKNDTGSGLLPHLGQFGDPSDMLRRKEILAAVEASLEHLSDKHRAVIVMRELQGMSYEEMAQAMKCSKGTIMSRLFHARRNMQRLLTEQLGACLPSHETAEFEDAQERQNRARQPGHAAEVVGGGM